MLQKTAIQQGLIPVFAASHELGERIYYDMTEREFYDSQTDLFLWNATTFGGFQLPISYHNLH